MLSTDTRVACGVLKTPSLLDCAQGRLPADSDVSRRKASEEGSSNREQLIQRPEARELVEREDMKIVQLGKDWEEMKLKRESGASMEGPVLKFGFCPTGSGQVSH